jgi:hypothetical protein
LFDIFCPFRPQYSTDTDLRMLLALYHLCHTPHC